MKLPLREITAWMALAATAAAIVWLAREATERERYVRALELELVTARRQGEDAIASAAALRDREAWRAPRTRALLALTAPGSSARASSGDGGAATLIDAPDASEIVVVVEPSGGGSPALVADCSAPSAALEASVAPAGDGLWVATLARASLAGDGGAAVSAVVGDGDGGARVCVRGSTGAPSVH